MIRITLVGPVDCPICEQVSERYEHLREAYPITIEKIDAYSPEGEELVMQHGILASPGVFIGGAFVGTGNVPTNTVRAHIENLLAEENE